MQAGAVQLKLEADISNIVSQMQAAERLIKMTSTGIENAFSGIKSTALGIGASITAALSIGAFKTFLEGTIKASAGLNDLAIIGNTTVEALSGLASIGKYSDTGADAIVSSMNRLTKNLTSATEESAGTGKAIQALGLDMEQFRNLKPEDQMQAVAKAMDGFQDGAGKSAVAMALYGKEGAKMLPFMKDLAAAHELEIKLTTEQAAAADNLDDNITRIGVSSDAWKKTLVTGMVPALDEAAQAYLDVMNGTGGLNAEIKKLAADGSIAEWTRTAIKGLTYVADGVTVVWRGFRTMAMGFFGYLEMAQQAIAGNFSEAKGTYARLNQELSDMWSEQTMGQRLRARLEEVQNLSTAADKLKPKLEVTGMGRTDKAAGHAAIGEYAKLIDQINEKTAATAAELTQEVALTEGQKLAIKIMEQLRNGKLQLSIQERQNVTAALESMLATEQLSDAHKAQIKATKEANEAHVKYLQALDATNAKLLEDIEAQKLHNAEIGLSKTAIAALVAERDEQRASLIELQAIKQLDRNGDEVTYNLLMREAAAVRELSRLKREGADKEAAVEEAKNATVAWTKFYDSVYNGLTDNLYRAFEQGKGFFESFWKGIRNLFKTTVLKLMIQGVVGSILSGVGMPGAASAQGQGGGGGGGGLGGAISAGKSIYNAVTGPGNWFSDFGGNLAGSVSDFGTTLVDKGFTTFGTQLESFGLNLGSVSGSINTFADGLGYVNSIMLASKGQWGAAAGSAIGTYFGGPIGAAIGTKIGSWVDKLTGNTGTKPSIEGGYASAGTVGSANGKTYVDGVYGGKLDGAAKTMVSDIGAYYTGIVKSAGKSAGNLTAQAFIGMDGNEGSKGSQNALGLDAQLNGKWLYNRWTANGGSLNAGTTDGQMSDAVKLSSGQVVIEALKETNLGPALNAYLATVTTQGKTLTEVTAVLSDVTDYVAVNKAVRNLPFKYLTDMSVEATRALIDAAGGLDKLLANVSTYFELFGTEAEKSAALSGNLADGFAKIGITMPANTEGLREWYKSEVARLGAMDLSIAANAEAYNSALQLASGVNELAPALRSAADIASEATGLQKEYWQAIGDTASLRAAELEALDPSNRAMQTRLWYLEDERAAQEAANAAYKAALATQQQYLSGMVSAGKSVRDLLASMQVTVTAGTSPQSRLAAARSQYIADLSAARAGDMAAYGRVTSSAQTYMGAGSEMYASGSMQQAIIAQIQNELSALPAVADYDRNYTALQAIEAAIKLGNKTLTGVESNTYGLDKLTRISDYVHSLQWGNASVDASSTAALAQKARTEGWTSYEIGAAMGFSGPETRSHFAKYGVTDIPLGTFVASNGAGSAATTVPIVDLHSYVRSLPWGSPEVDPASTANMYAMAMQQRWTQAVIAADLGLSTSNIQAHFARYGYPAFAEGGAFTNGVVSRPTMFNMAQMGEAGAEAIMPLTNIGGTLGVRAVGADNKELTASVKRLESLAARQADLIEKLLSHQAAANTTAIGKQERIARATEGTAQAAKLEAARP